MRLKAKQTGYVAAKIGIDLANADFATMPKGKEAVVEACKAIIDANLEQERKLDAKVEEMLDANYDEIEVQQVKERELFFMIKKRLAPDFGLIMNYDDRYNEVSHLILDELYENYLLEYEVNDNQIRNVIFKAFKAFAEAYDKMDDTVYEKIQNMQKEYVPGSVEYELVYERLYEEELKKRGMF
ncbi:MAG: Hypothetical protein probably associated with Carbamoyl-phosphate synthase [uncultured Sulfurovum sp.]|uniref:Competence protein n=1 Tax=uncultured Sulfurovum sp. TaxID=269237 RepID=A0A6S6UAD8_9BACT|nr:MAG: Hypothetical protein probably associated with Carbamoyl-phosphate synthase [uncultured Sulfurovum sp.]